MRVLLYTHSVSQGKILGLIRSCFRLGLSARDSERLPGFVSRVPHFPIGSGARQQRGEERRWDRVKIEKGQDGGDNGGSADGEMAARVGVGGTCPNGAHRP